MNKLGVHLMMWQAAYDTPLLPLIGKAKRAGFDGVEFPLVKLQSQKVAEEIRREADTHGLKITTTFGFPPELDIASADKKQSSAAIDRFKTAIDISTTLGSDILAGVLYSGYGIRAENPQDRVNRWQRSVENMQVVAGFAASASVKLAIEPVNRYETDLINTSRQGIEYIKCVGASNLYLLFDVFHAAIEEENIPTAIRESGEFIGHVHFSENHRGIPGTGSLPYLEIAQALMDIRYDRWGVVEIVGVHESEFARRFKVLRCEYLPDEAALRSASFLRNLFNYPNLVLPN
jgi:D-psicose/D-tagatose/L-ribulose 3-epimerase